MKSSRISTDLGDPRLIKLLKLEAELTDQTMRDVLVHALESYFNHRLETRALTKASEAAFSEWNNPLDGEYDHL